MVAILSHRDMEESTINYLETGPCKALIKFDKRKAPGPWFCIVFETERGSRVMHWHHEPLVYAVFLNRSARKELSVIDIIGPLFDPALINTICSTYNRSSGSGQAVDALETAKRFDPYAQRIDIEAVRHHKRFAQPETSMANARQRMKQAQDLGKGKRYHKVK